MFYRIELTYLCHTAAQSQRKWIYHFKIHWPFSFKLFKLWHSCAQFSNMV